jgi:cystathionine gamma-synthase
VLRSLATLPLRVRQQAANALAVAHFLHADRRRVERVHYAGLPDHPGHQVALRQMEGGFGGVLSMEVPGGKEGALAVAAHVKVFTRATSLGGVESLIEHRASIEGPQSLTPPGLLRLSIGLEHVEDLIADLDQALG